MAKKKTFILQKYVAEFLGTFILTLAVLVSLSGGFPVPTPVIAGLALGFGVYALGGVSGAHFNPAITIGLLFIRKISVDDAVMYLAAQLTGAAAATQIGMQLVVPATVPVAADHLSVVAAETIGTFVFATGVAAAAHGKISQGASGLAVGGSLLLGISLAVVGSNGVLNPAVALGIGSFSVSYLIGPVLGAILAMILYKYIID